MTAERAAAEERQGVAKGELNEYLGVKLGMTKDLA
jgi:hypothetical protein